MCAGDEKLLEWDVEWELSEHVVYCGLCSAIVYLRWHHGRRRSKGDSVPSGISHVAGHVQLTGPNKNLLQWRALGRCCAQIQSMRSVFRDLRHMARRRW